MNEKSMLSAESKPRFAALIPFFVFMAFYLGLSIWANDFYCVPMPIAFLVASATALFLNWKQKIADKVEVYARSMGDTNIMIMCLIFILAGAFAAITKAMGAVDAAVLISRHLIPDQLILVGFFLISCFISVAIGTSCGTIAALTPIAAGLIGEMEISPALMLGAVIGGAMFGDNMSMISDTTIAATRTQGVAMRDKFLMNLKMIFPAAIVVIVLYCAVGKPGTTGEELDPIGWQHIIAVIPYLAILIGALCGCNVMALLFLGAVVAGVIGILTKQLTFWTVLAESGKGTLGMAETLIVALLAGGLLGVIRHNGGVRYLLEKITGVITGKRGCEIGVAVLVAVVNLFTANNTVAIIVAGPVAKDLASKFGCDPRRIASILDSTSCVIQGMIPYGAQILIAIGIAREAGIEISSLTLIGSLYYPMFLGVALLVSILIPDLLRKKTPEKLG